MGTELTLGSGAKLKVNADGSLSYDPRGAAVLQALRPKAAGEADIEGTNVYHETFTYRIVDAPAGGLGSVPPQAPLVSNNRATVTITVTGVNDAPWSRTITS